MWERSPAQTRLCENWGESDREGRIDNDAAFSMSYIRGEDREQASFLPARIDDYIGAEAAVRVIDAFAESRRSRWGEQIGAKSDGDDGG